MPTATDIRRQVLTCVREVVPEELTPGAAVALVEEFAVIERAAATGRMFCALRVARSDAWRGQGHATAADWLAAKAGISVREAAAQLGTAKRAADLPKTRDAMRSGRLSPTQAGAVTDGASADPAAEDDLLSSAEQDTTAALKEKAAKARAAATDSAHREARIRAERSVRTRTDPDGAFHLHLRGPAADGIRITAALRPFVEEAFRSSRRLRADGVRDTFDNRTYDAFLALLGLGPHGLEVAGEAAEGGVPADGGPAGATDATPAPAGGVARPPGGNNVKVIVRVDHSALVRGHTVAGETCDIPGLGPIPVAAAREALGGAFLAFVITKGRDVATVAHLGRGLNAHQRTAVEWSGLRCSNAACNRTVALQIDHRNPWIACFETRLDNQDPLCPDCHRRKTHHGWHLEPGVGPRRFLPSPDPPGPRPSTDRAGPPARGARPGGPSRRRGGERGAARPSRGATGGNGGRFPDVGRRPVERLVRSAAGVPADDRGDP